MIRPGFLWRIAVPLVLGLLLAYCFAKDADATDSFDVTATVQMFRPGTLGEVPSAHLEIGGQRVTLAIMGDDKVRLVRWLQAHDKQRIRLRLDDAELVEIAR